MKYIFLTVLVLIEFALIRADTCLVENNGDCEISNAKLYTEGKQTHFNLNTKHIKH